MASTNHATRVRKTSAETIITRVLGKKVAPANQTTIVITNAAARNSCSYHILRFIRLPPGLFWTVPLRSLAFRIAYGGTGRPFLANLIGACNRNVIAAAGSARSVGLHAKSDIRNELASL